MVELDVVHEGLVSENHATSTVQGAMKSSGLGCEVLHLDGNHHTRFTFCLLRRAGACCCRAAFCSLWALGGIVAWWWFALALGPFSLWTWAEWAAIDSGLHLHVPNGLPSNDSTSRQRPTESDLKHNKNMRKELTSDAPKSSTTNIASSNVFHSLNTPGMRSPGKHRPHNNLRDTMHTLSNAITEPPCLTTMALSSTSESQHGFE